VEPKKGEAHQDLGTGMHGGFWLPPCQFEGKQTEEESVGPQFCGGKKPQNETTMADFNITASSRRFGHFTGDLSKPPMDILKGEIFEERWIPISNGAKRKSRKQSDLTRNSTPVWKSKRPKVPDRQGTRRQDRTTTDSRRIDGIACNPLRGNSGFGSHCSGGRT